MPQESALGAEIKASEVVFRLFATYVIKKACSRSSGIIQLTPKFYLLGWRLPKKKNYTKTEVAVVKLSPRNLSVAAHVIPSITMVWS